EVLPRRAFGWAGVSEGDFGTLFHGGVHPHRRDQRGEAPRLPFLPQHHRLRRALGGPGLLDRLGRVRPDRAGDRKRSSYHHGDDGGRTIMTRVVTFGEIMLRLKSPANERLFQSPLLEATFGGGECNVAVSLANYGLDAAFVTAVPKNNLGDAAIAEA